MWRHKSFNVISILFSFPEKLKIPENTSNNNTIITLNKIDNYSYLLLNKYLKLIDTVQFSK